VDEHNAYSEYVNQLPDAESPTLETSDANNNMDRSADRVGAAVAAHLGPLLRGLDTRLDVLNKVAARLLLQAQQAGTGTTGNSGNHARNPASHVSASASTRDAANGVAASNGAGGLGQKGTPQYEYVGVPAEAGLRREISRYCAEVDRVHFGGVPGKANKVIFGTFGFKSRSQMGLEVLGEVLAWAREEWPLS
jgi:hypothetical protein